MTIRDAATRLSTRLDRHGRLSCPSVTFREAVLGNPRVFEAFRKLIGADNEMIQLLTWLQAEPGSRILDFGCGNGRIARFTKDLEYVGVDNSLPYIEAARETYGSPRCTFICEDLRNLSALDIEPVDSVVAIGVLHHLDDDVATVSLRSALKILKPGGVMVTMDPCFEPSQSSTARVLMALDRGKYVRHPSDYQRLGKEAGGTVSGEVWTGILRYPFSHWVQRIHA